MPAQPTNDPDTGTASLSTPAAAAASHRLPPITTLLLLLLFLPTAIYYIGLTPSMGIGTALPALAAWLVWQWRTTDPRHYPRAPTYAALTLCAIAAHFLLAVMSGPVELARGISSLLLLAVCLLGSIALAELLSNASSRQIQQAATLCLHIMGIAALLGALGWLQPDIASFGKSVFPFTEPSHLALCAAPLLIFVCVRTPKLYVRILYLGAALLVTAVLQNLTLVVICFLVAAICLPLRYLVPLAALLVPVVALNLDLSYYTERLDFSDDSKNLSALVFLQGWLLIDESWDAAGLLGRGFQQLGVFGTDVYTNELIQLMNNDESLNLLDGGFVLSKLLSEFGLVGAILALLYFRLAWRTIMWLRQLVSQGGSQAPAVLVLAASSITAYGVELMVRGAGYFTASGVLFVASLWIWIGRSPRKTQTQTQTL